MGASAGPAERLPPPRFVIHTAGERPDVTAALHLRMLLVRRRLGRGHKRRQSAAENSLKDVSIPGSPGKIAPTS